MADQVLSSFTNFVLGILVARALGVSDFGAFTLALTAYWIALGFSRAITSEIFVVRYSSKSSEESREVTGHAAGVVLLIGALAGLLSVGVGWWLLPGLLGQTFIVLGPLLPGLLLQDFWRFAFMAASKPRATFVNDLIWTIALFPALALVFWGGWWGSTAAFVLAWGCAGTVAGAVGMLQARLLPLLSGARQWLRIHSDLGRRYVIEFLAMNSAGPLSMYLIGLIAGLAALGSLRSAQILVSPVQIVIMASSLVGVPEAVRLLRQGVRPLKRASITISLMLAIGAMVWGGLMLAIPPSVGTALLGSAWMPAHDYLAPAALTMAASGAGTGALIGLRALGAASRSLRARLIVSILMVVLATAGAAVGGGTGAAWGLAIAVWLGAVSWWAYFLREIDHEQKGVDPTSGRGAWVVSPGVPNSESLS